MFVTTGTFKTFFIMYSVHLNLRQRQQCVFRQVDEKYRGSCSAVDWCWYQLISRQPWTAAETGDNHITEPAVCRKSPQGGDLQNTEAIDARDRDIFAVMRCS